MTNYSKLSDAEIAELVCRKLGWDGDWISVNRWLTDLVSEGFADSIDMQYQDIESPPPLRQYLCFDWPAPIMMQKVEEWLVGRGIEIHSNYCQVDKVWTYWLCGPDPEPSFDEPESTGIKPRALYEAFLQVEAAYG